MNLLFLSGMLWKEAREVLRREGITDYEVEVTGPPRLLDKTANDNSRVIAVYPELTPIRVLLCKP